MKTFQTMLVPALLTMLAMPASAQNQDRDLGAKKPQPSDADITLALVSTDKATARFADLEILDAAVLVVVEKGKEMASVPDAYFGMADLYWQHIEFRPYYGFCPGGIFVIPRQDQKPSKKPQNSDADADADAEPEDWQIITKPFWGKRPSEPGLDATKGASYGDVRSDVDGGSDAGRLSDLPMSLQIEQQDTGEGARLVAAFDGTSNDFGLTLVDAVSGSNGTDVYLYRKVPGVGEGMLDIVEHHSVSVDLPATGDVRVFLAEGTTILPKAPLLWRQIGKLQR